MFKAKHHGGGDGVDGENGMVRNLVANKDSSSHGVMASSRLPPSARYNVVYCSKGNLMIDDAFSLQFLPPISQLEETITQLEKLKEEHKCEYVAMLNNKYLDVIELRNLFLVHEIKNIKYQVEEENKWCRTVSTCILQPNGTPAPDLALLSTFTSMPHDTNEGFFWPNLQLKTCEVKSLASNRWLSDLIIYRIAELINKSNPDTYAFYYNFVSDIRHVIQRIHIKHTDVMPKKIIFAINVGKWKHLPSKHHDWQKNYMWMPFCYGCILHRAKPVVLLGFPRVANAPKHTSRC